VISAVEVLAIHDRVIATTGGSLRLRDEGGLLSAVARSFHTFEGKDLHPNVLAKAGALLHALCTNHPFVDGNKRTALVAAAFFLHKEGVELDIPVDDAETFMLRVAQGLVDAGEVSAQLAQWCGTDVER
jgi:death-on-curing protein